ncbi:MAG: hypothetical protein CMB16_05250 [Euryarchaeota archaeon]|nr:hypothetical protein [Euryarchaeota archaeon]|tara:strand:- start:2450 stop:3022 length:573 start_codon:yes stop_codon:yes gene_type:complete
MADPDEMILAGSTPTHSNPIDALHSRTCFVLAVDSLLLTFFFYTFFGELAFIPGVFFLAVWSSYKSKSEWAYWFVPLIIGLLTVGFCLLMVLNVYQLLVSLNITTLIFILILGYAIFSSVRFIRIHFHPVYRMGYSGESLYNDGVKLAKGEMLAACPSCLAVLAINPMLLSPSDICPHCNSRLVLSGEEE